ncbi:peroxisomal coenzyme A diphosphatase NUDT7 [Sebastes umbrosus]|uniref:peroxisomal coenzyme A diphosphatase NUDT7 n=1 Tax=Sebastes umbrosus TaxID=72105 RepID=UPI00189FD750|nr:peroxisomal coenzyme A diphosphatase NUDT7 [Sebastes umbrosus]XP_037622432.1 peroxisomal coenzyme A diphosphatase NUDT7 [Sebastes umbrosus]XP_037622433.1 peroxisomal coenzyme A diphosphatase NUDT7 [Sebastes umbrosus]XP_037622434.1 peroxisomal coenzyme A diphosphatase NUDT7 [Sebastes umbrosus]XP_037622436.1 peroxisomal coenzyme A diphosphatase NUDT7 [Sebastes umbrosus]XP_037622437.1 peroxisomal coenzyme A diphosphatase NUDT7 [Sebastes umbrosus]
MMFIREETIHILKQFDTGDKFSSLPVPTGSRASRTSSEPSGSPVPTRPRASVLIPLLVKNGELFTLMTLRSTQLRTSAGEVCFPGGKRDPSDGDDVDTALREAEEEIGLPAGEVQVVCRLVPIISKSGLLVTPVVGFIDESFCPSPNPAEVSDVFTVPLDFFTSDKDHHAIHGAAGTTGQLHSFHFVDPDSGSRYHIFGLTAMFAILVAALALRKKPQFDVAFDPEDPLLFFQQILHRRASKL